MNLKRYFSLFFFLLTSLHSFAQMPGVCNPANRDKTWGEGSFEIIGNIDAGCSPLNIQVLDKTGGQNIAYDFNYTGGGLNTGTNSSVTLETQDTSKVFTVLQYALKDGKTLISCKNITVSPSIKYSVSTCDADFQISFPKQTNLTNQTIKYKIDGLPEQSLSANSFPYTSGSIPVNFPFDVEVYAVNSSGARTCSSPKETIKSRYENIFLTRITELEVLENNKARIKIEGSYDPAPNQIQLHRAEAGKDIFSQFTAIPNVQVGTNIVDIPDPSQSYCFMAFRVEDCGTTDYSTDICTIPIKDIEVTATQNKVFWTAHKTLIYDVTRGDRKIETQILVKPENQLTTPYRVSASPYIHTVDCKKEYCYQVESKIDDYYGVKSQNAVSKSLKKCFSRKEIQASALSDLFVNINANKSEIYFSDNSGWPVLKEMFYLYNAENNQKLDSAKNEGFFLDSSLDPSKQSICFKIGYKDACNSLSELSPEVCTIHLSHKDLELNWTNASPFSSTNLIDFEVENQSANTTLPKVPSHIFTQELRLDTDDEQIFIVKALDDLGNESYSNPVSVSPKYFIRFPSAFTPNDDILNNTFQAFGRLSGITNFEFVLYDRWANQLIKFDNPDFDWDGKINGKKVSAGNYSFTAKGTFKNGETFSFSNVLVVLH